jgi:hypothetical protein
MYGSKYGSWRALPIAAIAVLALVGCAAAGTPDERSGGTARDTSTTPSVPPVAPLGELETGIAFSTADFDPVYSPIELAEDSEIVISGAIAGAVRGPQLGRADDDFPDVPFLVIQIGDVRYYQGKPAEGSDGNVYLVAYYLGSPDEYLQMIPIGTRVVLYANAMVGDAGFGHGVDIIDPYQGVPEGQQRYASAHPQGFVVDLGRGDGALWWPYATNWALGKLDETLPDGAETGIPGGSYGWWLDDAPAEDSR